MRTLKFILCAVLLAVVPLALADPFNPFNTRPVPVYDSGEPTLQSILNTTCPGCGIDAYSDQQSAGFWALTTLPPHMLPVLIVEYAGFALNNIVGMFSADLVRVPIFPGPAAANWTAKVSWQGSTSGKVTLFDQDDNVMGQWSFLGIPYYGFGFYLESPEQNVFYSVDDLNSNKQAQVLAYREPHSDTWILAFEDRLVTRCANEPCNEPDYNDFVMKVESIVPVPEPAAILLVGSVLLLVGRRLRARA